MAGQERSKPAADAADNDFRVSAPQISLPKGGGAIRGIGEKFAANPVTGTGSMSVPIPTSPGRSGFGPQLSLTYDSGAGNGAFGFGWSLSLPSITRKTDKGLPQYHDAEESDVFILSGAEDLVPVYRQDADGSWVAEHRGFQRDANGFWVRDESGRLLVHEDERDGYRVRRYRPRIEGLLARIERWSKIDSPSDVHWRSISKDNFLTLYGFDANSRIADPLDASRIFSWLVCESRDDKGNGIRYLYKNEDGRWQPRPGQADPFKQVYQLNRGDPDHPRRTAQRYLHRVLYGNRQPLLDAQGQRPRYLSALPDPPTDTAADWLFEVRFDYGELDEGDPSNQPEKPWFYRPDAFSSYRSGFEVRTCRRCERVLMLHQIPDQPPRLGRRVQTGYRGVVRSIEFVYDDELDITLATRPIYSFLKQVVQTGWTEEGGTVSRRSLPPVEFEYSEPVVQDAIEEVDPQSLDNLPIGPDGAIYRWVDLHGEGIPGILTEVAGGWYYKRNWSPVPTKLSDGSEAVKAKLAPLEAVARKPNVALSAGAEFMDLAGDGQPDVVVMEGPAPGLHEHDETEGWQPFRPFTSRLNRNFRDRNLKFIDLDGDGHPDVLITETDDLVWHPSLAEEGFGPARRVAQAFDEDKGPRIVFADGTQSIYLADMSGDGLTDLVRIRNSEICYWPNLGYCRFGAKITMIFEDENGHSACFDHCDQFDHKRIRLADIDGSGTTDIIYLHRDGVRLYFNQSGNGWSQPHTLKVFPRVDDVVTIVPTDLLGNGTACLVWSSPLPGDARRPMRYVNLMGQRKTGPVARAQQGKPQKPHLLVAVRNNLGAEIRVEYAPSTKFYLQDKQAGRPWITRLPFPVQVVERVETYDHISRNRFVTRCAYHHGCFDGEEREFRGFGMVEQWDTEQLATLADGEVPADNFGAASHVPPVHTKTWFHTGVYLGRERVSRHFEGEYFHEPALTVETARTFLLDDTIVPHGLTLEEEREACRALKGSMLRQEVYADDANRRSATLEQIQRARTPYSVTEQNFSIRTLQRRGVNRYGVFLTHACEAISYHYERNSADPRIKHALTLEVDDYGNVLKQAAIGYGRRVQLRTVEPSGAVVLVANPGFAGFDVADKAKQTTPLITYTERLFTKDHDTGTDAIDRDDIHRIPLPCEVLTFELTGYSASGGEIGPATDPGERILRYRISDFVESDPAAPGRLRHRFNAPEVAYEATANGNQRRRPIERLRTLYRRDDLTDLLPLGHVQLLALPGESYKLCFTPGLLDQVFKRPRQGQPDELLVPRAARATILGGQSSNQGGYVDLDGDGHWWIPSGRSFFHPDNVTVQLELAEARAHFFLPRCYRDPFAQATVVDFDAHDLLMVETRDALANRLTVEANDYRVLQPRVVSDPNRNETEIAFDTLGMVVGTAVMGKPLPAPAKGDTLDGFIADLTQAQLDQFIEAPRRPSADGTRSGPTQSVRDILQGATIRFVYGFDRFWRLGEPPFAASIARETHVSDLAPGQLSELQITFSYFDGFGRTIQKKIQAEAGPVPQRDANGKIITAAGLPVMTPHDVTPRWVGSGWTVFNNKGKPVRQYEPFFTDTHRFDFDGRIGVSPVLFYDPAERVITTLHPNHTYEKSVFDPWQQTTWDVNDTCAPRPAPPGDPRPPQTGDPRTDPDIGGFVVDYFDALPVDPLKPWQTWHAHRIGNTLGPDERNAAERAAAHADTPTTLHLDALGRPFLTVARNRVTCADHPLNGLPDEEFRQRVELDLEGNQREVRDERKLPNAANLPLGPLEQRLVVQYAYDILGSRIHQRSMEAGARWMLNDVSGKPIRAWDSRGHNFTTKYDALRRPIEQYVRGTFSDPDPLKPNSDPRTLNPPNAVGLLVDKIEYGEPPTQASQAEEDRARRLNLRTRIYRHFDSAGIATNARLEAAGNPTEAYDFKGNLLRSTRQLVSDYKGVPDWQPPAEPQLNAEAFEGRTRYDALNRPIQSVAPHSSLTRPGHPNKFNVIQPVFNEANLLERLDVWLEHAAEPPELLDPATDAPSPVGVANIDYDAKGQRTLIDYKTRDATVIRTVHAYDPETFRLAHLYTRRGVDPGTAQCVAFTADCENPNPPPDTIAAPEKPPSGRACGLQNLHYTYDPAGNITHIRDDAQQTVYFRNQRVEPSNDYFYDALYRLIQADGREHLGQMASGERLPPTAPDAFNAFQMSQDQPNVLKAMGAYTERYVYDAVGNFLQMQHRGTDPAHAGWARTFVYAEDSLTEAGKWSNRLSSTTLNPAGNTPQPEAYVHDAQGSMLRMPHLARMDWDYRDRLLATSRHVANDEPPPDKLQQTTYYVYDASGQRVRKVCEKAPGLTEERIYLGGFEMFRKHGGAIGANTARLERETLHAMDNKQRIALVETCTLGDEPHVPRRLIRYQFGNHIGSASLELDDQAQIISYEEYSPYGSSTYQAMSSQTETPKRYRYTGKERDEESGLYYHEARYYAANLGRWTSSDPNGVRGGIDMYVYAASRPVVLVDPQGTQPCTASPLVCDPKDYKEPKSEATGRLMLNTLSKGIENFDPIAQATAQVLAGRIWERQSGANGSYYYAYSKSKVEALGKSIGLTAEESSELAAMVRSFAPSDNRLQMDYAGRVGTRASLASREASEKLEIVLNPGSGIGGILAGFVGMAGGTAADMRAVAQAGGMLEAAGMAKKGAASDAINASTPRNVGIDQSTARTSAARGGSGSGDGGRAELPASDPGQASRLRAELAAKHLANADRRGVGKDVIKNPMVPGSGLKADAQHRMASFLTENEMASATVTPIKGADGIPRTLVQVPNYSFEGKLGIVEYVIDKDGAVTHQRFIEGGVIGAGPNNRTAHGM